MLDTSNLGVVIVNEGMWENIKDWFRRTFNPNVIDDVDELIKKATKRKQFYQLKELQQFRALLSKPEDKLTKADIVALKRYHIKWIKPLEDERKEEMKMAQPRTNINYNIN